ncbi:MAG TPA: MoaD/ThiS family protein, partial [Aggregatilineales bacterium]|nr:MoaD/ThiS family protein [Aggregatilineales bacterium]
IAAPRSYFYNHSATTFSRERAVVTVTLYATLRDLVGSKRIEVPFEPGGTVRDFIEVINRTYPQIGKMLVNENGELSGEVHVFVHGRNVMWLDNLDTVINEGDDIDLIPPVAGG